MKCPFCGTIDTRVTDSRPTDEDTAIRRRRECAACTKRFTTYEKVETLPLMVVKKDGRREAFDAEKLRMGLIKACEKRPISSAQIDDMVREIESELYNSLKREIPTREIGDRVMVRLKGLDEVAYVRFAAVYHSFKDAETFLTELKQLLTK